MTENWRTVQRRMAQRRSISLSTIKIDTQNSSGKKV